MKKVILAAAVVFILGTVSTAFAHGWGHGQGYYGGCGNCYYGSNMGPGMKGGMGPGQKPYYNNYPAPESVVKNAEDAKAKVKEAIKDLKGYKVGNATSFDTPRGTAYQVEASDASGNKFIYHVNPWGMVRGPWLSGNN